MPSDKSKSDLETRLSELETVVARLVSPGLIFTGMIENFKVANAAGAHGPQINFTHANFNQLATIAILRNISRDVGSAVTIQSYTHLTPSGPIPHTYSDNDPAVVGKKVFYWIQITLTNPDEAPILIGPFPAQA